MKFSIKLFLSLFLITGTVAYAADTASILPPAKTPFFDNNGNPLTGGKIDFYIPGTTTRKATWQDSAETILNDNPVILDAAGRALILGSGIYRQVVKDRNNNLIWDQVTASPGSGGGSGSIGDSNPIGTVLPFNGFVVPSSYVLAYGQEISRTTYSVYLSTITQTQNVTCTGGSNILTSIADTSRLNIGAAVEASCIPSGSLISAKTSSTVTLNNNAIVSVTTSAIFFPFGGGNGLTTFNVPDYRGKILPGRNNMGGASSGNLTSTYYGSDPNALNSFGGNQYLSLLTSNLPPYTPSGGVAGTFSGTASIPIANLTSVGGATDLNFVSARNNANATAGTFSNVTIPSQNITAAFTGSAQGGASTPVSIIQPSSTVDYIVKIIASSVINSYTGTGVIVLQDSPTINTPIINNAVFISDSGPLILNGTITPAAITTSQNNYNPSSTICTTISEIQISSTSALNITGFGGGVSGCLLKVINSGGFSISLKVENLSSSANNRFAIASDLVLRSQDGTLLTYDGTVSRWRQIGGPPATSGGSGGTVTQVNCGQGLAGGSITTSGTCSLDPKYIGTITAAKYGAVCDGVTDDTTAMNAFADAVGAAPNYIGVAIGTSSNICRMTSTWLVPDGNFDIIGGGYNSVGINTGATIKFEFNGTLIRAKNSSTVRSFAGKLSNLTIEGTSNVTYPNTTAIDMQNASSWILENLNIFDVRDGIDVRPAIKIITNITKAATAVVTTATAHGYINGQTVHIDNVQGMTQVNGNNYVIAGVTAFTFQLQGINSTGFGAYTSAGTVNLGTTGLDAANYNRFQNINIQHATGTAFIFEYYSNANVVLTSRCNTVSVCVNDGGDDNSVAFSQFEGCSTACVLATATSNTFRSISNRYENGLIGNSILSGANSFTVTQPFYSSLGTNTSNSGTFTNRFDIDGIQLNGGSLLKGFWSQTRSINFGTVTANTGVRTASITDFPLSNCLIGDEATVVAPSTWGGADSFALSAQPANGGVVVNIINQYTIDKTPGAANFVITCRRYGN